MKRYHIAYSFLTLALLLSCQREELQDNGQTGEAALPITVSASPSGGVRSSIIYDYPGLIASGKSLGLFSYAHFDGTTDIHSILENAKLSYNAGSWTYSPLQYWLSSADDYHFFCVYPYIQSRLSHNFIFPNASDEYLLGLQEKVYPIYETWAAEDYAKNNIIYKSTVNLYLTNAIQDLMFGDVEVTPDNFGSEVDVTLNHAACAVRFRIRNLSEKPFTLTNWYMTGLKNHSDMVIHISDCPEEDDPLRFMTIVPDQKISEVRVSDFNDKADMDSLLLAGSSEWIICADGGPGVKPGDENYYKYVVLSSRLKQTGKDYGLSHNHSSDGTTITYSDGTGTWTDPKKFVQESAVYQAAMNDIKTYFQYTFPNYKGGIFWGPTHKLDADNFFIPLVYERGAQILDFNGDRVRGDSGDYSLKIHQFECRSHMFKVSDGVWKANGGIYLPVSGTQAACLYSPYFLNAENHGAIAGDWKEAMSTDRWSETDPNYNNNENGKQRSVFLWTANNASPAWPVLVDTCITNMNAVNGHHTPSVSGGDLATVLNDWGYLLMYPQTLDHLTFEFYTAPDVSGKSNPTTASYNNAPSYHSFNVKDYTPGREWVSGNTYDYLITVSNSGINLKVDVEPWNEREIDLK